MSFTLANTDNFAAKQGTGTDVSMQITGDDRTISGSTDAYSVLAQSTLTASAVSYLAPASGHDYIVSSVMISNPGATARVVTFYLDKGGTTYDATTQWGPTISLGAGEAAEWISGRGWTLYNSSGIAKTTGGPTVTRARFAPAQAIGASRVYMTNTNIVVAALVTGHLLKWRCSIIKTGAGAVAPILEVLFGTNGSTADTARFVTGTTVWTLAMLAQTAVIDRMILDVEIYIIGSGASGTVYGAYVLNHTLAATGFSTGAANGEYGITGAIDISAATNVGLVVTAGTSAAWTLDDVRTEIWTP